MGDNEARRDEAQVPSVDRRHWSQPNVSSCTACDRPIRWVRTVRTGMKGGKVMPLDPEPVEGGNVELTDQGAVVHGQPELAPKGPRYVAHFASCKNWRAQRPKDAKQ